MAGSASATAGTPKVQFSSLRRTNGTHFSVAYGTENSTVSVGSGRGSARPMLKPQDRNGGLSRNPRGPSASPLPARSLALLPVLKPLPRYLADPIAFVFRRDLPGLIEIGRRQQAVGEQEVGEITRMTALFPDETLQQLLVVGYRALSAQVQGDHHAHHRHRLRGGQAEDELLVVIGHRQARRRVAREVPAHADHRVFSGLAASPHDRRGPGGLLLAAVREGWIRDRAGRGHEPRQKDPGTDADQPRPRVEGER